MNEKNENNIKNDFLRKINILDGKEYDMIQIMKKIDNKVQFYSLVDAIKKKTYEIETIYSDKNECFYKDSKVFSLYYSYCVNQYGKFIDTMSDYTMQMKKNFIKDFFCIKNKKREKLNDLMKSLHNDFSNFDITNSKYIKKLFITELDNYTKERHEIQTYDNPNYNYLSDTWNSLKMELNNIGIIVEKELDNEINVLIEKKYKELNSTFNSTKINEKKEYDKNLMKEADEVTKYNEDAIKKAHNLINMMENNLITTDENGNIVYLNEETENNKKVF